MLGAAVGLPLAVGGFAVIVVPVFWGPRSEPVRRADRRVGARRVVRRHGDRDADPMLQLSEARAMPGAVVVVVQSDDPAPVPRAERSHGRSAVAGTTA
jgi:hypothetical protein